MEIKKSHVRFILHQSLDLRKMFDVSGVEMPLPLYLIWLICIFAYLFVFVQLLSGGHRPVQVIITESGNQPNSHPIQWNAPQSAHITQYILKWRVVSFLSKQNSLYWRSPSSSGSTSKALKHTHTKFVLFFLTEKHPESVERGGHPQPSQLLHHLWPQAGHHVRGSADQCAAVWTARGHTFRLYHYLRIVWVERSQSWTLSKEFLAEMFFMFSWSAVASYHLRVSKKTALSFSISISPVVATSQGETTQPPPVVDTSESVTEITSSSFVISWVSASDTVSGFRVEYELTEQGQGTGQPIVLGKCGYKHESWIVYCKMDITRKS